MSVLLVKGGGLAALGTEVLVLLAEQVQYGRGEASSTNVPQT